MSSAGVCWLAIGVHLPLLGCLRSAVPPFMTIPAPLKPAFRPFPGGYPVLVSEPTYTDGGSQQTDKHGRLLDEELQHETRGLVQDVATALGLHVETHRF